MSTLCTLYIKDFVSVYNSRVSKITPVVYVVLKFIERLSFEKEILKVK
jgi:hypothetical protein